jgi:hypothetical protein
MSRATDGFSVTMRRNGTAAKCKRLASLSPFSSTRDAIEAGLYTPMMRTSLLSLITLLMVSGSAFAADKVTFTYLPLAGGQTVTEVETLNIKFGIDIFVGEANLGRMDAENSETETATAVLGKWNAKKKIATLTYGKNGAVEKQTTPDGKVEVTDEPSPLSGKAYKLSWKAGKDLVMEYAGGGEPTEEERALVLSDWEDLISTEPSDFAAALVDQTIEVGGVLPSDSDVLAKLLSLDDDDLSVTAATVTLQEVRMHGGEKCGVFAMDLTISGNDAEMSMTMAATGEAILAVSSLRPHSVTLSGPVTLAASVDEGGVTMNMTGGGDFAFGLLNTYSK